MKIRIFILNGAFQETMMNLKFILVVSATFIFISCGNHVPTSPNFTSVTWSGKTLTYLYSCWRAPVIDTSIHDTLGSAQITVEDLGDTSIGNVPVNKIRCISYFYNIVTERYESDTSIQFISFSPTGWQFIAYDSSYFTFFLKQRTQKITQINKFTPSHSILIFPLEDSASWIADSMDQSVKTVIKTETISTEAGMFECKLIRTESMDSTRDTSEYTNQWYSNFALIKQFNSNGLLIEIDSTGDTTSNLWYEETRLIQIQ